MLQETFTATYTTKYFSIVRGMICTRIWDDSFQILVQNVPCDSAFLIERSVLSLHEPLRQYISQLRILQLPGKTTVNEIIINLIYISL